MRVLIIDSDLTGLDFAWRCVEAGHEVKLYQKPNFDRSPVWDGFGFNGIERVSSWENHMTWMMKGNGVAVNLFNDAKITRALDRWRAFKAPIFGPTMASAKLEEDRGYGMKIIEQHGIEVPAYHTFKTLDECIKFAWKAQDAFVFKTLGSEEDKSLSYVGSDPADMVSFLEKKRDDGLKLKGPCMLQEKVEMIAEVGISAWVGKEGFLPEKFNVNFEYKKLLPGNFGPNTGEMGTVTKYVEGGKLADEILKPFEELLVKLGHIGDVDIGCGIDSKGKAHPFEFSARFGWPSSQILMASHTCDPVEWMRDAATTGNDSLTVDTRVAMGVLMCRPPFPNKEDDPQQNVGYKIDGIEEVFDHVSPWQMMIGEGPVNSDNGPKKGLVYKTTGPYVCVVTGHGPDVHDVIPAVYSVVDKIQFADRIVRNDIGMDLEKKLPKVIAFGYDELPLW